MQNSHVATHLLHHVPVRKDNLDVRALLRMAAKEEELWGTWNKIIFDWFQKKTSEVFLTGTFKFAREQVNMQRVWRVSRLLK